jgi:uncharacterized protein
MLKEKLTADLKDAMKKQDALRLSTLRMVLAAIRNKEIEKRLSEMPDEEIIQVLSTEARKRKESVVSYESAGRQELADKEKQELAVIKTYLPEEASEDEIRKIVKETAAKIGASSIKDMGKVMGGTMAALKGRAEGGAVQKIVKEVLGS